ncbi:MAG TPA: hypothetical protein VM528_06170, partial [Burkholderiaceae bacterium]|nr:hypothetical protein [Burkholderiaceae bacterium]
PDYSFTYRTTRLADVQTDFLSQVRIAMDRSGILLATDTIAAGLRSLQPPVPRAVTTDDKGGS